ncbi:MAG TPA: type II toxin-antitoxin system RelE/ParE family toxin [Terriglobales bacterium]|jgi:plasmid stabilization system protein ParE|nr:type II toxin-antitoxin system RelE/ParE family toxin [Terriglobales bacterium]
MTSKPFRFHPEARVDLRDGARWYRERNPAVAAEFRTAINDVVRSVAEAPRRWPTHLYGTRRFVLQRFPFSVIYLDDPDEVVIVAVAHGKRKPGYWKRRV